MLTFLDLKDYQNNFNMQSISLAHKMIFFFGLTLILAITSSCQEKGKPEESMSNIMDDPQRMEYLSFQANAMRKDKKVVLISGDEEYRSEEGLPQLAKILSKHHGFDCTVLFAQNPEDPGRIDPNYLHNIPGLEALVDADLMIIFTRFRELPDNQMQYIDTYLKAGKPVIGLRTATHAFNVEDTTSLWLHYGNYYDGKEDPVWKDGFGRLVLGEHWVSHHGHHKHQSTRGIVAEGASDHPITNGLQDGSIWGSTDVYAVRLPLPEDSQPIIMGQVIDRTGEYDEEDLYFGLRETDTQIATTNPASKNSYDPNDPMMPIAWTKSYQLPEGQPGKAFTSTIGSSSDLLNEGVRRLIINAAYWLTDLKVPKAAEVSLVGTYQPTAYGFKTQENYWKDKNLRVKDFAE